MNYSQTLILSIAIIGIIASFFRAWVAVKAFMYPEKKTSIPKYHVEWYFHQGWIHFIGSMVGWASLLYLLIYSDPESGINIEALLLFVFACMGIMGFLPALLWNITWSTNKLVDVIKNKI